MGTRELLGLRVSSVRDPVAFFGVAFFTVASSFCRAPLARSLPPWRPRAWSTGNAEDRRGQKPDSAAPKPSLEQSFLSRFAEALRA